MYILSDRHFLVNLRKKHNLSQQQVADYLFISRPTYSCWERNCGNIPMAKFRLICKLFDLKIEDLIFKKRDGHSELSKSGEDLSESVISELEEILLKINLIKSEDK